MRRTLALTVLFACCSSVAVAQGTAFDRVTPPLPTEGAQRAADIASWVTVGAAIWLDTKASCIDATNRRRGCGLEAVRLSMTYALMTSIKAAVRRERPCAPDCGIDAWDRSFPSMHTAFACQATSDGRRMVSWTLALGTGAGRVLGKKHFLSDVAAGCLGGWLIGQIR